MANRAIIKIATPVDSGAILQLQRLAYQGEAELYQAWSIPPLRGSLEELLGEFRRQVFLKAFYGDGIGIVGSVRASLQDDVCSISSPQRASPASAHTHRINDTRKDRTRLTAEEQ